MVRVTGCLVAAAAVLSAVSISPAQGADGASRNLAATRQVYAKLLAEAGDDEASLMMFATMLPKGGDIHHHFSGAIYAETYLEWARQNGFCIFTESRAELEIEKFHVAADPSRLTDGQRAACKDVDAVTGDEDFYRALLMAWSSKDFNGQSPGDMHFFETFQYFSSIAAANYARGMQQLKARAIAENVGYIETIFEQSPAVSSPQVAEALGPLNAGLDDAQLEALFTLAYDSMEKSAEAAPAIDGYIASVKAAAAGVDDERFTARFVAFVVRNQPPEEVFSRLYTAFRAVETYEKLVGVNFVGPENGAIALRDYSLHMKMFAFFKRKHPHVRIALHAGELALGMVPPEDLKHHINEAVRVAGASRIGHGVDIPHETGATDLLALMRRNQIAVEINLTSNKDILGISGPSQPLHLYRKFGVPYVISTDDAGVSRNTLSSEYLRYITGFRPSYDELKATVFRSIAYAFLTDAEKAAQTRKLKARFLDFETAIAASAGHLAK